MSVSPTEHPPDHKQEDHGGKVNENPLPSAFHKHTCRLFVQVEPAIDCLDKHAPRHHAAEYPRIPAADVCECVADFGAVTFAFRNCLISRF